MSEIRKINHGYVNQPKKSNKLEELNKPKYDLFRSKTDSEFCQKTDKFFDKIEKRVELILSKKKNN